jgi:hypothetical protein
MLKTNMQLSTPKISTGNEGVPLSRNVNNASGEDFTFKLHGKFREEMKNTTS